MLSGIISTFDKKSNSSKYTVTFDFFGLLSRTSRRTGGSRTGVGVPALPTPHKRRGCVLSRFASSFEKHVPVYLLFKKL